RFGLRLSAAGADFEVSGMDWPVVVAVGLGLRHGVRTTDASARSDSDHALVQQVHSFAAGQLARKITRPGPANRFSRQGYSSDGWEQTFPALERIFYRLRPISQNRLVRHA